MKTSFEFEKYRKNLADNLREKISESGFENAREDLEKEEEKPEYQTAKGLKLMKRQIENTHPESREAFDLIVEKYDISDKIPNSLKFYIDKTREEMVLKYNDRKLKNIDLKKELINSLNQYDKKEIDSELKESFSGKKVEDLDEEHLANLSGILLVNKLTEGALKNENNANHVVNGEGADSSLYPVSLARKARKDIAGETLFNVNFDPYERFISKGDGLLHLSVAKERGRYFRSYSQIIIINPTSDRFLYLRNRPSDYTIKTGKENGEDVLEEWEKKKREEWEKEKRSPHPDGFIVSFEQTYPKWVEIADWIVDLSGGKLYRITEEKK